MNNQKTKKIMLNEQITGEFTYVEILARYTTYINKFIRTFENHHEHEDLFQIAAMGLLKAYDKYDITTGYGFYPIMKANVNTYVLRYVSDEAQARRKEGSRKSDYVTISIHSPFNESAKDGDAEMLYEDIIYDVDYNLEKEVEVKAMLNFALNKLTKEEKELIYLYFYKEFNQSQLAKIFNTTQVTISRRKKNILNKMKNILLHSDIGSVNG